MATVGLIELSHDLFFTNVNYLFGPCSPHHLLYINFLTNRIEITNMNSLRDFENLTSFVDIYK